MAAPWGHRYVLIFQSFEDVIKVFDPTGQKCLCLCAFSFPEKWQRPNNLTSFGLQGKGFRATWSFVMIKA